MGMKVFDLLLKPKGKVSSNANHRFFNALYLLDHASADCHTCIISKAAVDEACSPDESVSLFSSQGTTSCVSSSSMSLISDSDAEDNNDGHLSDDPFVEEVIRRTQSDSRRRLIYQPEETSSILVLEKNKQQQQQWEEENHMDDGVDDLSADEGMTITDVDRETESVYQNEEEVIVMTMQSEDPYLDFMRSMEEMLDTQGILISSTKDDHWGYLEELLGWYLHVNGKSNHGYIVGAFVDLLINKLSASS